MQPDADTDADTGTDTDKNSLKITNVIVAVFAFYLIIGCNFLPQLFSCRLQHLINNNMIVKHLFGLFILFFLVVNLSGEFSMDSIKELFQNIIVTVLIYIWFVITTRSILSLIVVNIIILCVLYIIHIRKNIRKKKNKDTKADDIAMYVLSAINVFLSILGFCLYLREKKLEYGDDFRFSIFMRGNPTCKGYAPLAHAKELNK